MTCAFPLKGNCVAHGCFRKRIGNRECDHEEVVEDAVKPVLVSLPKKVAQKVKQLKEDDPIEIKEDDSEKVLEENKGRFIVCIGNQAYFNLK